MELLAPFLQGTSTPYNMPVYPGAQCIIANSLIDHSRQRNPELSEFRAHAQEFDCEDALGGRPCILSYATGCGSKSTEQP